MIVEFASYRSCVMCKHLCNLGNGKFACTYVTDGDGNDIYPIDNFKKSNEYNLCDGEYFELEVDKHERTQRRKIIKRGNFIKCAGEGS